MSFEAALAAFKCSVKNHTRYFSHSIAYVKLKFVRIATNPKCDFHIYQYLLCANWPSTKSTFLCTNENCTDSPLYFYAKICSQTSLPPYRVLALETIVIMISVDDTTSSLYDLISLHSAKLSTASSYAQRSWGQNC